MGLMSRKIGVKRFQEKLPHVQWTGLYGAGGEDKQYGFEPHVSRCPPSSPIYRCKVGRSLILDLAAQRFHPCQRRTRCDSSSIRDFDSGRLTLQPSTYRAIQSGRWTTCPRQVTWWREKHESRWSHAWSSRKGTLQGCRVS